MKKLLATSAVALALAGCAAGGMFGPAPKDGELSMPAGYRGWPVFLAGIEKATGHVRDIYINPTGASATKGQAFPNGTVSVMEIYKAKNENGRFIKGDLDKVFVMAKGAGWGASVPEGQKNGDWIYAAFDGATGAPAKVDYATCRGCHTPLADKDYIFHYDKYFDSRKSASLVNPDSKVAMSVEEAHKMALLVK